MFNIYQSLTQRLSDIRTNIASFALAIFFSLTLSSTVAASPFAQGLHHFEDGDFTAAVESFTQAIEADKTSAAAYSNRCLSYLKLDNYQDAIEDCSHALELFPNNSEGYLNRGLAYHRLGQYTAAMDDYNQLLSTWPQDFRAHHNRGLTETELGRFTSALGDFELAERFSRQADSAIRASIFNDWGLVFFHQGNWEAALTKFNRSIRLNPNHISPYFNRGCVCHRNADYACALKDFTQVVQLEPNSADAYMNLGMTHAALGRPGKARQNWEAAAALFLERGDEQAYRQAQVLLHWDNGLASAIG
ncbi:tetratricopeptide repeat protein [Synechococcus sp. PCC 7336]|uniref:tetratricopeptide repeat protein n=1 Tax=Synechococcus sp. PCC 7336 TaxID=195250 RepID=UPI00034A29FC|nr:tetratricopeptide repeat protein [Synechococcus sp. PCC 7336]